MFQIIAAGELLTYSNAIPQEPLQIFQFNPTTQIQQEYHYKSMLLLPNRNYTFEVKFTLIKIPICYNNTCFQICSDLRYFMCWRQPENKSIWELFDTKRRW